MKQRTAKRIYTLTVSKKTGKQRRAQIVGKRFAAPFLPNIKGHHWELDQNTGQPWLHDNRGGRLKEEAMLSVLRQKEGA